MTLLPDYCDCPMDSGVSHGNPYPLYAALRTRDAVCWNDKLQVWLVSRRSEVQSMLSDPRWSSDFLGSRPAEAAPLTAPPRVLLFKDGPDHLRLRRIVSHHVNALLPMIRTEVETSVSLLLDRFRDVSEIEFASEFASPLATRVLAALLGIPHSDLEMLANSARKLSALIDWTREKTALEKAEQEIVQFTPYLLDLLRKKRRRPGNDLVSSLAEQAKSRTIGYSDVVLVTILTIAAGHLTSVHMLCNGLLAILQHRHVMDGYRAAAYTPAQILEETLRFDAPVQATPRTALIDLDLGGKIIRRGDIALALLGSANRDEAGLADPDFLNPARQWRGTMSFGAGPHYCLGAGLARITGEVAFSGLLAGYPHLGLAEQSLRWKPTLTQHGLAALRVRL